MKILQPVVTRTRSTRTVQRPSRYGIPDINDYAPQDRQQMYNIIRRFNNVNI